MNEYFGELLAYLLFFIKEETKDVTTKHNHNR
jgi:hypothetical protein